MLEPITSTPEPRPNIDTATVHQAWQKVRTELLESRNQDGHWTGELSSSALATATAISALAQYRDHSVWPRLSKPRIKEMIDKGICWLMRRQNMDGGWGDTEASHSNVATSMLVVACFNLAYPSDRSDEMNAAIDRANMYIDKLGRVQALRDRYGKDKTFAVPILANCAVAGLVDWNEVAALPFEAALVPQKFYRFIKLPVVSYAIPALVAIGQAKFIHCPPRNPITRLIRKRSVKKGMDVLQKMQPASGGYLEAIPLTCFVAMSLANTGRADHEVTQNCIRFIESSFRDLGDDGTWPIDTNLATWNTTLAINALGNNAHGKDAHGKDGDDEDSVFTPQLLNWVLSCQYKRQHPFTGSAPGGWGWSDLSGAVPDADDTPGALLALRNWVGRDDIDDEQRKQLPPAAINGVRWLLDLQNRDKGWPTFCKGWGRFPFDRSGADITAHVLRALIAWRDDIANHPFDDKLKSAGKLKSVGRLKSVGKLCKRIDQAIESGFNYLDQVHQADGSWLPLWFGNQDHPEESNPVYGTVKVLLAYRDANRIDDSVATKAIDWLLRNQNADAGWGGGASNHGRNTETAAGNALHSEPVRSSQLTEGPRVVSSLQETSLVVELLASIIQGETVTSRLTPEMLNELIAACRQSACWLVDAVEDGKTRENWPIGFYFAKLWYYERLYPLVFSAAALNQLRTIQLD